MDSLLLIGFAILIGMALLVYEEFTIERRAILTAYRRTRR